MLPLIPSRLNVFAFYLVKPNDRNPCMPETIETVSAPQLSSSVIILPAIFPVHFPGTDPFHHLWILNGHASHDCNQLQLFGNNFMHRQRRIASLPAISPSWICLPCFQAADGIVAGFPTANASTETWAPPFVTA